MNNKSKLRLGTQSSIVSYNSSSIGTQGTHTSVLHRHNVHHRRVLGTQSGHRLLARHVERIHAKCSLTLSNVVEGARHYVAGAVEAVGDHLDVLHLGHLGADRLADLFGARILQLRAADDVDACLQNG